MGYIFKETVSTRHTDAAHDRQYDNIDELAERLELEGVEATKVGENYKVSCRTMRGQKTIGFLIPPKKRKKERWTVLRGLFGWL